MGSYLLQGTTQAAGRLNWDCRGEPGDGPTVVLDGDFSAGRDFGADGTLMAVLVDAAGRIASDLAAGGQAV